MLQPTRSYLQFQENEKREKARIEQSIANYRARMCEPKSFERSLWAAMHEPKFWIVVGLSSILAGVFVAVWLSL
jgi:hypothetical protein